MHAVRQMVHNTLKLAHVIHAVVFADGILEARNAHVASEKQHLKGLKKQKYGEPNDRTSDTSERNSEDRDHPSRRGRVKLYVLF